MTNQKQTIVLATNHKDIDGWVEHTLSSVVDVTGLAQLTDHVLEAVQEKQPDLLLLNRFLPGKVAIEKVLMALRQKSPATRIILLMGPDDEKAEDVRNLAISLGVYDLALGKLAATVLESFIRTPNRYADVAPYHTKLFPVKGMEQNVGEEAKNASTLQVFHPKLVAFWSPKGGTGATTLAVNTAVQSAMQTGFSVSLLDFHLYHPHISTHLGLADEEKGIASLLKKRVNPLDEKGVARFLTRKHKVDILQGLVHDPELVQEVTESLVSSLLQVCKQSYGITVVDVAPNVDEVTTFLSLKLANMIYVVIDQDLAAIEDAARSIHMLERLGIVRTRLRLVVNRYQENGFSVKAIEKALDVPVTLTIPLDFAKYQRAIRGQRPLTLDEPAVWKKLVYDVLGQHSPKTKKG
jgi:Flp pilus assembly CpaE family ATPase